MIISKGAPAYPGLNVKPKLDPRQIMNIEVKRTASKGYVTIGRMTVDGGWICYTLEDPVREPQERPICGPDYQYADVSCWVRSWKVKGQTAIPRGTYQVILAHSQHFGRIMPHLLNVPGYDGILIHSGNIAADTEGCILVGFTIASANSIGNSRGAFQELFSQIEEAIEAGQKVWCTIA